MTATLHGAQAIAARHGATLVGSAAAEAQKHGGCCDDSEQPLLFYLPGADAREALVGALRAAGHWANISGACFVEVDPARWNSRQIPED